MQIRILFNNQAKNSKFQAGWGFSCLIDNDTLFDVGADAESLKKNIELLGVDFSLINHIVISHDHWDHTGGLWWILSKISDVSVYICPGFSKEFIEKLESTEARIIQCVAPQPIVRGIVWTTGQMQGSYEDNIISEQSLIIDNQDSVSIVTGCAHSGIVNILNNVKESFPKKNFDLVLGGFHLHKTNEQDIRSIIQSFQKLKVKKVAPMHCTGDIAVELFKKEYGDNCLSLGSGDVIDSDLF